MSLDCFLLVLPEHLRTFARLQELLVVSLQSLDQAAVLLWTHLGQLQHNKGGDQVRITDTNPDKTTKRKPSSQSASLSHHAEGEGVDVIDVLDTVLPRDETLDVDVELVPDVHDGLVILLVPVEEHKTFISQIIQCFIYHISP